MLWLGWPYVAGVFSAVEYEPKFAWFNTLKTSGGRQRGGEGELLLEPDVNPVNWSADEVITRDNRLIRTQTGVPAVPDQPRVATVGRPDGDPNQRNFTVRSTPCPAPDRIAHRPMARRPSPGVLRAASGAKSERVAVHAGWRGNAILQPRQQVAT